MSTTNSPTVPKFVSVEGADIHARSKPDGELLDFYTITRQSLLLYCVADIHGLCRFDVPVIRFRLVSYNILAQVYHRKTVYAYDL